MRVAVPDLLMPDLLMPVRILMMLVHLMVNLTVKLLVILYQW